MKLEKKFKVLIVEDLPSDVELAVWELSSVLENYSTKVVDTENEYVEALKTYKPDLIVSDYQMPTFNGMTALKIKQDIALYIPFVLLTGSINEETAVEVMKAGADDYVIKEHIKRLGSAVLGAIDKKKTELERNQARIAAIKREKLNRAITETAADAIITIDDAGTIIAFNTAAENIFGYSFNEILNKKLIDIIPSQHKKSHKAGLQRIKDSGKERMIGRTIEITALRKKGEEFPIELSLSYWESDDKTYYTAIIRDITKRKVAEGRLKYSEERFKQLAENAQEWIWEVDSNGLYSYASDVGEKLLGYNNKEIVGKMHFYDLFHSEEQEELKNAAFNAFNQKLPFKDFINRNIAKNGEIIWLSTNGVPMLDNNGNLIGYRGADINITERKQAEEKLQASKDYLDKIINSVASPIFVKDDKHRFCLVNDALCSLLNRPIEKIIGTNGFEYLPEDQMKVFITKDQEVFDTGKENINEELLTDGTGKIRTIVTQKTIYTDPAGNKFLVGVISDITKRKQAENSMRESEEKFRSLVDNSPDIIMRIDSEGVINYINYEYSNQKPEEIIGNPIYKFIPSDFHEVARNTIKKVLETGKSNSFENLGIGNADKVKWYRNNIAAIKNGKTVAATVIVTDITEQKQTEIMQNEFIASASHELRTPLTIIRESLSLLSDGLFGELNSDQLGIVNPCMEDVDRLARILNNLLTISNIEGHKLRLELKMFDIVKLAQNTVSSFEHQATDKNIELVFSPSNKSLNLYLDRDRIIQVFMNLIGNAIKFTKEGKIEIIITEKKDFVVCCIKDTGKGLRQKDLGTLFDRLHQVGKIMRTGEKGSGLGLSICKGIVKAHNGKVWVNSEINKGSKFFFSLPKYSTDEIIIENIENEIKKFSGKHIKRSLLLVRLNNFSDIETKFDVDKANSITKLMHQTIQDELAPGDFSFIKEKNEVILFSDVSKQNIAILFSKLEDMLAKSILKINKDITADLSYSCSIYPDDGDNADELMQSALQTLLKKDKDKD